MTGHGFRAVASTLLNESGKWNPDAIERALGHGENNGVQAAYHRGAYWEERVRMAQWWSDYLDIPWATARTSFHFNLQAGASAKTCFALG